MPSGPKFPTNQTAKYHHIHCSHPRWPITAEPENANNRRRKSAMRKALLPIRMCNERSRLSQAANPCRYIVLGCDVLQAAGSNRS